jgi:hypothetical protein
LTAKIAEYVVAGPVTLIPGCLMKLGPLAPLGVTMATVLVVAGVLGAGIWVAVRLERGLDTAATLARGVTRDHPRGLRGGCRTARRAYPVRCAGGWLRRDVVIPATRHAASHTAPAGACGGRPRARLAPAGTRAADNVPWPAHDEVTAHDGLGHIARAGSQGGLLSGG